jgi:glycosyl transferase family 87
MSNQLFQSSHTRFQRQEQPDRRRYQLLNLAILLLTLGWLALLSLTLNTAIDDFKVYRQAGIDMLQSGNPYITGPAEGNDGSQSLAEARHPPTSAFYSYPPLFAYLMQPFGLLPQEQAQLIWFLLNCTALGILIVVCIQVSKSTTARRYWGLVALGMVFAPPTRINLQIGQVGILLALPLVISFALAERRARIAGFLFALTSLLKIYPVLLGLYYILRRPRRMIWWSVVMAAILLASSALIFGLTPYVNYFRSLGALSSHYPQASEHNISLAGFWSRLLTASQYGIPIANLPVLANILQIASGIAVLGICLWF